MENILTISDAGYLSDIMRAVEAKARITWYPYGGREAEVKTESVIRAFAHDGGGFWFDKDGDVRDAYIWTSGTMEHWYKVSDVMDALRAMTGSDDTVPIATIEYR